MRPGEKITPFSAADQDGELISSTDLLAKGPLVVYFYVKAKTPG